MNRTVALITALGLLVAAPPGLAGDRRDQEAARAALARKEILPLPRILAIAAERLPGDVLKIELEHEKEGFVYEVRVLGRDGRVNEIEIDAKTGKVLWMGRD